MIAKFFYTMVKIKKIYIVLAFLLIGISILGFKYYRLHDEFSAFKALHEQSVTLTTQMLDIKSSLATIDRTLNQLNKFSSKLKVIARIKIQ